MDNTTWESLVIEVNEYKPTKPLTLDCVKLELNLQIGTNNPNEQTAQGALKALLKEETELRSDVNKSAVPASVRVAIDRICGVVEGGLNYYNHDAVIGAITMKHIKSGGGAYENAEEYASAVLKQQETT